MSTYKGETPSQTDPRITQFFQDFYAMSDDPTESTHESYARAFTDDATVIMGTKRAQSYPRILEFRKALWSGPVKKRLHTLNKIFPFGGDGDSNEVMVYGTVDYELKNGKDVMVEWAGHAVFTEKDGGLKMKFYQVYMDSAPVAEAVKES